MDADVEAKIEAYIDGEIPELPLATEGSDRTHHRLLQQDVTVISDI